MLINNKNINIYNCKCLKFIPSTSNYSFEGIFTSLNSFKAHVGQIKENTRTIDTEFLFKGDKDIAQKNISRFIEEIKHSIIESCSFFYEVILEGSYEVKVITNNSFKINLKLTLLDVFEDEKYKSTSSNTSIQINSPKPCMATLEVISNTAVISCKVTINDIEITIRNIKGNEKIIIGEGKILAGGKSKIDDVDIKKMPILNPGNNILSVNRADVTITIKYKERW